MITTSKTSNQTTLRVKLDEPDRHFRQGDIVSGTVIITPNKQDIVFDAITVHLKGFIQTRSEDGTYCQQTCFLALNKTIDSDQCNAFHVKQTYRYPFEFEVPTEVTHKNTTLKLPPSFEIATTNVVGTCDSIHYAVEAAIVAVKDKEKTSYFQEHSGAKFGIAGGHGNEAGSANNTAPSSPTATYTAPIRKVSTPILVVPNYHPHLQAEQFDPGLLQLAEVAGDCSKAQAKFDGGDVQIMGITSMNKIPIINTSEANTCSLIQVPLNIQFTPGASSESVPELVSLSAKLQATTVISHEIPHYLWASHNYDYTSGKPVPRQPISESSRTLLDISQKIPGFEITDSASNYTVNFGLCVPDNMKQTLVPTFNFESISHAYQLKFTVTFSNKMTASITYPVIITGYTGGAISAFPSSSSLTTAATEFVSIPVDMDAQSTKFAIGSGLPEYENDSDEELSRTVSNTSLAKPTQEADKSSGLSSLFGSLKKALTPK